MNTDSGTFQLVPLTSVIFTCGIFDMKNDRTGFVKCNKNYPEWTLVNLVSNHNL